MNKNVLIFVSGLFLGLAIYTKVPSFTFIPLVGSIVYFSSKSRRQLMMWLAPVFLIPLLWPLYAVSMGQGDLWAHWVLWQTERNKPLGLSLVSFFQIDPVIAIVGTAGIIFAAIRKDFFPLVWVAPFSNILLSHRLGSVFSLDCTIPRFLHCFCNFNRFNPNQTEKCRQKYALQINDSINLCIWICGHNNAHNA